MPECPYCGDEYFAIHVHRMRCVAEDIAREHAVVLDGIANEIEARSDSDELEDVIEQLRWTAENHQEVVSETLKDEVSTVDN